MSALKDNDMTEDKVIRDIVKIDQQRHRREFEFIGVLRHMQQYFTHICSGTDVQAD